MKSNKKVIIFFLMYALILQIGLKYVVSDEVVYTYRMNYDIVKDRTTNIEAALEKISHTIKRENLKDYIVILGDSVGYSNPGPANESLAVFLNEKAMETGKDFRVFNLSMPAMQTGDIYTMLLKMKQHGISSDHVIIDLLYAGFVQRTPNPPIVFWLDNQLKALDKEAYLRAKTNLELNNRVEKTFLEDLKENVINFGYENISVFKYKDYLVSFIEKSYEKLKHATVATPVVKPWTEKPDLKTLLQEPMYQRGFSDKLFIMDESNLNVYFVNKIIELQEGKDTLIFLAGINTDLMNENVTKPGYQENLQTLQEYFNDNNVTYIDFNGKIDTNLFSDYVHLTPEGYRSLTDMLWEEISAWDLD